METQLENRLEEMLRLAADEPAHRLEFYRVLLSSEIYVFGTAGVGHEGAVILDAGNKIGLQHWEKHDGPPWFRFSPRWIPYSALSIKSSHTYGCPRGPSSK